jgi:hypothetical protein
MRSCIKICPKCGDSKDFTGFCKNRSTKDGLSSWCRSCKNKYDSSRKCEVSVEFKTCFRCKIEKSATEFSKCSNHNDGLQSICRICDSGYEKMLPEEKRKYVRGLLCFYCNVACGKFKDDSSLLRKAADYLDFFEEKRNKELNGDLKWYSNQR